MEIRLHNTLGNTTEPFKPLGTTVGLYHCGPTVYNDAHIGNLRSYVFADILRRTLEWNGYEVKQIVNITDIGHLASDGDSGDDKMVRALRREGLEMTMENMHAVAKKYFERFKTDLAALNIETPHDFPFASDHVTEDIEIIEKLQEKGFVYQTSDGLYFDTAKFPGYGKLGGTSEGDNNRPRITENSEKKNPRDFALWKFVGKFSTDSTLGFDSPFGKGFPGWHIECSVMSRKYLGQPFDIHTGGIDHIPVHHNNEIAQSEAAFDTPLAKVWMHNAFLNIKTDAGEDAKMSKSGDNFTTLATLRERGIDPLALRYFYLTAQYSSPLDFSYEALEAAQTAWKKLRKSVIPAQAGIQEENWIPGQARNDDACTQYKEKFTSFINDNLDTPKALALVWEILKDKNLSDAEKRATILDFDRVLGLKLNETENIEIPAEVQKLIDERDAVRAEKNWSRSDELRSEIESLGFSVRDTDHGTEVDKI